MRRLAIDAKWFNFIKQGKKRLELQQGPREKWENVKIIEYKETKNDETCLCFVYNKPRIFHTLEEIFTTITWDEMKQVFPEIKHHSEFCRNMPRLEAEQGLVMMQTTLLPRRPRLLVIGYRGHGKDTVCELLCNRFGLQFQSSSLFCAQKVVRPWLEEKGIFYPSVESCFYDRDKHRPEWFNAISHYTKNDRARLAREIFSKYDIYCGLRNHDEYVAIREENLCDVAVWIDASKRVTPEPQASCTLAKEDADFVLDNNGSLTELTTGLSIWFTNWMDKWVFETETNR